MKRKLESVELSSYTKRIEDVEVPVHLIGDSAFPLLATLMKPYSASATMSDEATFDYRLSRARRVLENDFGRLKARLRISRRDSSRGEVVLVPRTFVDGDTCMRALCEEVGTTRRTRGQPWTHRGIGSIPMCTH